MVLGIGCWVFVGTRFIASAPIHQLNENDAASREIERKFKTKFKKMIFSFLTLTKRTRINPNARFWFQFG